MRNKTMKSVLTSIAVATVGLFGSARDDARAALVTYAIDPSQSMLTLSGNLTDNSASQQGSGSLSTSFSGSIVADRNPGNIRFVSGSVLDAALQLANQQPRNDATPGSQPADYGRTAPGPFGSTTLEAIRGLQLDLFDDTSGLGAPIAANGNFVSSAFGVEIDNGESDSIYGTVPNEIDLSGKGTANSNGVVSSTVILNGAIETLTLKIATGSIGYGIAGAGDSSFSFNGTIVARREVPEPASFTLVALGAGIFTRRRRK
jgi:hypothetical protein